MTSRLAAFLLRAATILLASTWAWAAISGQAAKNRQVAGCPATAAAFHAGALEKVNTFNPPRMPDGQPDLQGLWEAPMATGLGNIEGGRRAAAVDETTGTATSLVVDPPGGSIPYQPWARAQTRENVQHYI